uniref:Uncharacterized protein n=1 Tax=Homalodisca liturata TaxID=320908 RepID=A0A1B6H7Y8_9HEMI
MALSLMKDNCTNNEKNGLCKKLKTVHKHGLNSHQQNSELESESSCSLIKSSTSSLSSSILHKYNNKHTYTVTLHHTLHTIQHNQRTKIVNKQRMKRAQHTANGTTFHGNC